MTSDKVSAAAGRDCFSRGWQTFRENALVSMLITALLFAIAIVLYFVPVVGGVVFLAILPLLMAGSFRLAAGAEAIALRGLVAVFLDVRRRTVLMVLGLVMFAVELTIRLTFGLVNFGPMADLADPAVSADPDVFLVLARAFSLPNLVLLIVQLVVGFGFVFAAGLLTFSDIRPVEAFVEGGEDRGQKPVAPARLLRTLYGAGDRCGNSGCSGVSEPFGLSAS